MCAIHSDYVVTQLGLLCASALRVSNTMSYWDTALVILYSIIELAFVFLRIIYFNIFKTLMSAKSLKITFKLRTLVVKTLCSWQHAQINVVITLASVKTLIQVLKIFMTLPNAIRVNFGISRLRMLLRLKIFFCFLRRRYSRFCFLFVFGTS